MNNYLCTGYLHRMATLWTLLLCVCMHSQPAQATTDAENQINKAAMPHQMLGAYGGMVKVHLTSLRGYLEGQPDNATSLARMQAEVSDCVRDHQKGGPPPRPPRAWPEYVISGRTDTYSAVNRTISYSSGLAYAVNPADCSLIEVRNNRANLSSAKGICQIDLIEKTAHGACDAAAQADARPPARTSVATEAQIAAAERNAASHPAQAALAAAMRKHSPAGTGRRKTILGLECEVWPSPLDPDGTVCLSRGGSFIASHAASGQTQSSMELEMTSKVGIKMHATVATLDAMVDAAVFAPYQAGGFRINNTGTRP